MSNKTVRSRLVWLVGPVGGYMLLIWILHPGNTDPQVLQSRMLAGFLFGLCYGLFLWRESLLMGLFYRFKPTETAKNQWPSSFYFGRQGEIDAPTPAPEVGDD